MNNIPIILLAAGSSKRMGQPKQLLKWNNTTLIENRIETLLKVSNNIYVVLGCHEQLIKPIVEKYDVNIVSNQKWTEGMGSSISAGIGKLLIDAPYSKGILITTVDQPFIDTKVKGFTGFKSFKQ